MSVKVDGAPVNDYSLDGGDLILPLSADAHLIEIVTRIDPSANTQLEGLYASGGMLCTQCEAEGFRRITFFPDRSEEHTSELQSLMRISYAVFCLKKKNTQHHIEQIK